MIEQFLLEILTGTIIYYYTDEIFQKRWEQLKIAKFYSKKEK